MPADQSNSKPVSQQTEKYQKKLTLWDTANIIVGIVVGVSIFEVPRLVFGSAGSIEAGMLIWCLGGILMLAGALCYAELASAIPETGGDYAFLSRTYGSGTGFLFGWAQFVAINPGNIGIMSYVFAQYAVSFLINVGYNGAEEWEVPLAASSVCILIFLNLLGLVVGKRTQNILTFAKVIGLTAIAVCGFYLGMSNTTSAPEIVVKGTNSDINYGFAMIFVLYAYGGWNDAAFVAAEVKQPGKNIPRALIFGTLGIMVIYLIVNSAYVWGLGFEGLLKSEAPAADLLENVWGTAGKIAISLVVMICSLGAINGLILTGSRVNVRLGMDHQFFAALAKWNYRVNAPIYSLLIQGLISVGLIVLIGTEWGKQILERPFKLIQWNIIKWDDYEGGFDTLVAASAPLFWIFFLLTGLSLIILRFKLPNMERPFRVPFYPFTPILFCLTSAYMLYSSLVFAWGLTLLLLIPVLIGIPLYLTSHVSRQPKEK